MSGERAAPVGLCLDCVDGARLASRRGSVFWRCARSARDAAFARYPGLPVLRCPGYVPRDGGANVVEGGAG